MEEITLLVTYVAKPGRRETFLRALAARGIPEAVRAEKGCVQYDYYLSLQNGDEILLVERWRSEDDQRAHARQPHMAALRELKERDIERTEIRKLQEAEHAV